MLSLFNNGNTLSIKNIKKVLTNDIRNAKTDIASMDTKRC